MEELLKILAIRKINYIYMDYVDDSGNFKVLKLDYRSETPEKDN